MILLIYFIETIITVFMVIYLTLKYVEYKDRKVHGEYGTSWIEYFYMSIDKLIYIFIFGFILDFLEYYKIYVDPLAIHWLVPLFNY